MGCREETNVCGAGLDELSGVTIFQYPFQCQYTDGSG